jgi:biotin carboxyl carrier protein
MVAHVWKVAVAAGQRVSEGDVLVILESMKTEIPVEAPHDGVVREIVDEGGRVGEGDVIAVVE